MSEQIPVKHINPTPGPIHTRSYTGWFRTLRLYGTGALFVLFFATVWLNWEGHQAVLWDLADRKFYIFGSTFWPQDLTLLSAILIIAAFGLFFATVIAGRIWCGYACPQSMWTWLFMWAEKVTEGDRNRRIKLDAAPWGANKLIRRSAKHLLWVGISLATGLTFIGYFTPIRPLVIEFFTGQASAGATFWVLSFAVTTYLMAGWLRENVCIHMCPYSRFQSVMLDENSLVVSYDVERGEPRGARRKDEATDLGSCIDCTLCVQVCPTGIDIREGLQLACIGCGACVDACDSIMDKMGYARGLVRYTSENELLKRPNKIWRPRSVGYAAVLVAMIGGFVWMLNDRPLLALDITRDRGLYRENSDGEIENIYRLKVINKTQQAREYEIELVETGDYRLQGNKTIALNAGEVLDVPVSVAFLGQRVTQTTAPLHLVLREVGQPDQQVTAKTTFVAPLTY